MRILITGFGGSIGSELTRQLSKEHKIFGIDHDETATFNIMEELKDRWVKGRVGDIRNEKTVFDIFSDFKPEIVFHAAAYKHVSTMEAYPVEAIETNILGTYNILHEAQRYECLKKFIYVSTDKVVNATSIMGATKKVGEIMVTNAGGTAVRFGNVLNSQGSVFTIWDRQLKEGKPLTITDWNMERYMMTIPDAVGLLIKAVEDGKPGKIYILDMGDRVKIKDLLNKFLEERNVGLDYPVKEIGIKPGETLIEKLMTVEEEQSATKKDNFYIL